MIKIDLITGFLGSGKTTFIKEYAKYLISRGEKICILENDYGAINVDMMLLQDLRGENCELEMVAGGCDYDCHKRRFKTKLISMGMCGYTRVIIEPSGIFDVDEFFDALYEEPLDRWYEIGCCLAIVNPKMDKDISLQSQCILASQIANAGAIVCSRANSLEQEDIEDTMQLINKSLELVKCNRELEDKESIICKDIFSFSKDDWDNILKAGYKKHSYVKMYDVDDEGYSSLYYMNKAYSKEFIRENAMRLFSQEEYGNIFRVKGFIEENGSWFEINLTKKDYKIDKISEGQDVVIVIGENLNQDKIDEIMDKK